MSREFMPKLNVQCEYSSLAGDSWSKIIPRFINRHICVFDIGNGEGDSYLRLDHFQFRPIRSDREKFIENNLEEFNRLDRTIDDSELLLAQLYDLGWRKL